MQKSIVIIVLLANFILNAQNESIIGPIPEQFKTQFDQKEVQPKINMENIAYGYETLSYLTLSMPIPAGNPLTFYEPWLGFATSMCLGGNGLYYVTTLNGSVYRFYSLTKTIDLLKIFEITGLESGDKVNGISYNPANDKYYIAAGSSLTNSDNIYELNINNGQATLVGPTNTGGLQADLTITCEGICYSYDLITKNSYTIDLTTGNATLLGPLGYNPFYGQGMDVDRRSGIVYLTAFDSTTHSGQLRILDLQTGETTLIASWWGKQICAFTISNKCDFEDCIFSPPSNPEPASNSFGVPVTLDTLRWQNDPTTTNIKLYFGEIWDMKLVYQGPVISSFAIPEIYNDLVYTWRVIAENNDCQRYSYSWIFGTIDSSSLSNLFEDDFENGTVNWAIDNGSGNCSWELFDYPYPNSYSLPQMPSGNVLSADADYCGTETTINSTALIDQVFNLSDYQWVWLEFDYDWRVFNNNDKAIVEVSTNGGITWLELWNQTGQQIRNCHEIVDITKLGSGRENVLVRFKSDQPGWDWWWAIDNIKLMGIDCEYCVPIRPTKLRSFNVGFKKIILSWEDNSNGEDGFNIERKLGDSLSTYQFEIVGTAGFNEVIYLDTTASASTMYTYRVNAFNQNGNSMYSNWKTITSFIPVELVSFDAIVNARDVELRWITASETNNQGFEILRAAEEEQWNNIGFVDGHGTTTELQFYSFTDEQVEPGTYQYKLKQIDYDGSVEYSNEINVEVDFTPKEFVLYQNYPNPFNPSTVLSYQIPLTSNVTLKVFDVLGNEVTTLVNEEKLTGTYETEFDGSKLTSGIYFYRLQAGSFVETKKMILMK